MAKKLSDVRITPYTQTGSAALRTGKCASQIFSLTRTVVLAAILTGPTSIILAGQKQRTLSSEIPKRDLPAMTALTNQLNALSPRVDPREANLLAQCIYFTANRLRREYGVVGPPLFVNSLFNNFLVNTGLRKRGLCFQWSEDMLVSLDALKLASLELHWGEARAGTARENNAIVVTAKGAAFENGIVIDCWRHAGHVHWSSVAADHFFPWRENAAYARFIRARSKALIKHQVAFHMRKEAKEKPPK